MNGWFVSVLFAGGCLMLLVAAAHDVAFRTVPNLVSAVLLALGIALRLESGGLGLSLVLGLCVLVVTGLFWRFGWMGGGDVKLLAAAAVFVPPALVPALLLGTAVAGGVLALLYLAVGRMVPKPDAVRPAALWRRVLRCELWRLRRRGPLPYAAAIAAGGVLATMAA